MSQPDPQIVREIAQQAMAEMAFRYDAVGSVLSARGLDYDKHAATVIAHIDAATVTVSWPDEQPHAPVSGEQQDGAAEEPCVCGDPNCMPYWRPVHRQMNEMRLRSDRAAADFTKAMLEEICEERTRAEQAEAERDTLAARVAELEAEREADVRVVDAFLVAAAVGGLQAAVEGDPFLKLRNHFIARIAAQEAADRIAALGADAAPDGRSATETGERLTP